MSFRTKSKSCGGCRYWSEMLAQTIGGGPVEAYCLNDKSPNRQRYVTASHTCGEWTDAYGYAIDAPGIDANYHDDVEAVKGADALPRSRRNEG